MHGHLFRIYYMRNACEVGVWMGGLYYAVLIKPIAMDHAQFCATARNV